MIDAKIKALKDLKTEIADWKKEEIREKSGKGPREPKKQDPVKDLVSQILEKVGK